MKKISIILLFISITGVAGFVLYQSLNSQERVDAFEIVPADAALIVEVTDLNSFNEEIKVREYLRYTSSLPFISVVLRNISFLDSIIDLKKDHTDKFQKIITSFHVLPGIGEAWISFIPVSSEAIINALVSRAKERKLSVSDHNFRDQTIYSIEISSEKKINCFYYKGLLVVASEGTLSEEVIRTIEKRSKSILTKKEEIRSENFLVGKIRVYLKYENFAKLWPTFSSDSSFFLKDFAKESIFELTLGENELVLNGYTFSASGNNSYLKVIKDQAPQKFSIKNYIPNSSSSVFYLGFDKPEKLGEELISFWKSRNPELIADIQNAEKKYDISLKDFYKYLGKEVAVCALSDEAEGGKLLLIETPDAEKLSGYLIELATKSASSAKVNEESYKGNEVIEINIPELPSKFFGNAFLGFPSAYFTIIDDHIIISGSREIIKTLYKDINSENVWGKTLDMNTFLGQGISEFNVGYFANLPLVYKGNSNLRNYGFTGFQFVDVGETVLSNIVISHHIDNVVALEPADIKEEIVLDNKIEKVFAVSGVNFDRGVLVQDTSKSIYLISEKGDIKWTQHLEDKILTGLTLLDINRDRRSDLIFGAGNKIYGLDYKGNQIKNFPIELPDSAVVKSLGIVDYIGQQQYRLIVSDQSGNIYIYNLKGENLEGWQPLKLDGPLIDKVKHVRVTARDIIIAVQENGTIHMRNRRGESYDNFPVKLDKKIISNVLIHKGKSFETSFITVAAEDRTLYEISMDGKVTEKKLSEKVLCHDLKGGEWLLAQKENKEVAISDYEGDKNILLPTDRIPLYYQDFTSGKEVFIINKGNQSFEIIDKKGNVLLEETVSLETSALQLLDGQDKYLLYTADGNKLKIIRF